MFSRRTFLISAVGLVGLEYLNLGAAWGGVPSTGADPRLFLQVSAFLTGRTTLDELAAGRALAGLTVQDATFPQRLQQLQEAFDQAGVHSVDELNGHALMTGATGDTAKKIISAWYLGYTGTPISQRSVDNTRFVTFTGALMYQPTLDATVIPTFSRGHTNYWTQPPATVKND